MFYVSKNLFERSFLTISFLSKSVAYVVGVFTNVESNLEQTYKHPDPEQQLHVDHTSGGFDSRVTRRS